MLKTRVIPCLLIKSGRLVKTVKFSKEKYIGDPINAIKIFNEKEVDELVLLDISATVEKRKPNFDLISEISSECFMPLCYGGGVQTIDDIKTIFSLGVEKVAINSSFPLSPELLKRAVEIFGSQSIVISMDVRQNMFGKYEVMINSGKKKVQFKPVQYAKYIEEMGAGEIFLNAIHKDGTQTGYDIELIKLITSAVKIPVIACGGVGCLEDFSAGAKKGGASAVAAGSQFVFQGKHRAVLISYPTIEELESLFN